MTLGLEKGIVRLEDYSPRWKEFAINEIKAIRSAIGDLAVDIQHVGSTAIPNIKAKPIVDIAIGLRSLADWPMTVEILLPLGYEYQGELGIPERHFSAKGTPRVSHVHVVAHNSTYWNDHLLFRDYLIANPDIVVQYSELKEELALKFADDRDSYTAAKDPFIKKILADARRVNLV